MARKPETWCRAFFSHGYACEVVENGVAEYFNGMIKQIRKKHLLTMLEEIRVLLMKRFFHQGYEVAKWKGNCGANIQLNIDEFGKYMRLWTVVPSGGDVSETRDAAPPLVSESSDQDGGPIVSPMKRTNMMVRKGGKTKVFGSRNKTPKKTHNGKKYKIQVKEDFSLTCDEDFDDIFTHTPNGKQAMSQRKEDV
ncbi:unnamed protein product [Lactuca saligna]|uniref:Uncharacterized protein n=1 Tax=Lactuca saligna TaxID=75948 RepID=A0AA35Z5E4_LACSI|nr:unnamed protein product [Lactuca saligna]